MEGGVTNLRYGDKNLLFGNIFTENCMKMKENGPRGGAAITSPLNPPMSTSSVNKP